MERRNVDDFHSAQELQTLFSDATTRNTRPRFEFLDRVTHLRDDLQGLTNQKTQSGGGMIHDSLTNYRRYLPLHPIFGTAFEQMKSLMRLASAKDGLHESVFTEGKQELLPGRLWMIVEQAQGRGMNDSPLEAHRRMIDIQLVLRGAERIGWRSQGECKNISHGYCTERDIEFFADQPTTWQDIFPGQFCIFFPSDAHAPLAGAGLVTKAIAKVAVDA